MRRKEEGEKFHMNKFMSRLGFSQAKKDMVENRKARTKGQDDEFHMNNFIARLGVSHAKNILESFRQFEVMSTKESRLEADALIHSLIQMNAPLRELRSVLKIGDYRYNRILKEKPMQSGGPNKLHVNEEMVGNFRNDLESWQTTAAYPCPHRRLMNYIVDDSLLWKDIHSTYQKRCEDEGKRSMKYKTWLKYKKSYYPNLSLSHELEPECDKCFRLQLIMSNELASEEEKEHATLSLQLDGSEAYRVRLLQMKFIQDYYHRYVRQSNDTFDMSYFPSASNELKRTPDHPIEEHVLSMWPLISKRLLDTQMLLQCEDFGSDVVLPTVKDKQLQKRDQHLSDIHLHMYVISDCTSWRNHVLMYDERGMAVDHNALCSLRWHYHHSLYKRFQMDGCLHRFPTTYFLVLDNSMAHSKNQAALLFLSSLSLLFYQRVVVFCALPGHSVLGAERFETWTRDASRQADIFVPDDYLKQVNQVDNVHAEFLDHRDTKRPMYSGWTEGLAKHIAPIPENVLRRRNTMFVFEDGKATVRHLTDTYEALLEDPPTEGSAYVHMFCENVSSGRAALLEELLGNDKNLNSTSPQDLVLPRETIKEIHQNRIFSLQDKYDHIPAECLSYYPPRAPRQAGLHSTAAAVLAGLPKISRASTAVPPINPQERYPSIPLTTLHEESASIGMVLPPENINHLPQHLLDGLYSIHHWHPRIYSISNMQQLQQSTDSLYPHVFGHYSQQPTAPQLSDQLSQQSARQSVQGLGHHASMQPRSFALQYQQHPHVGLNRHQTGQKLPVTHVHQHGLHPHAEELHSQQQTLQLVSLPFMYHPGDRGISINAHFDDSDPDLVDGRHEAHMNGNEGDMAQIHSIIHAHTHDYRNEHLHEHIHTLGELEQQTYVHDHTETRDQQTRHTMEQHMGLQNLASAIPHSELGDHRSASIAQLHHTDDMEPHRKHMRIAYGHDYGNDGNNGNSHERESA
jgi:hypothetical protein